MFEISQNIFEMKKNKIEMIFFYFYLIYGEMRVCQNPL